MRYTTKLRPVSTWTLPDGVSYELVALPYDAAGFNRPDLPRSEHRYGEFTTDRPLTADEMERFDIRQVF